MKTHHLILGAAWLLTLAAAYLLGSGRQPAGEGAPRAVGAVAVAPSKSPRSAAGAAASRPGSPPTAGASRGAQIASSRPPRQAVAVLARLEDPIARSGGFVALAESLTAAEFRDVVHDFRSLGITRQRMSEYAILLHAWAQTDPEGALDYALKNTGTDFARQTVLASWAGYDPDAALAFANEHAPDGRPNNLLVGVIRGVAPTDLARATAILGTLPRSEERGEALHAMLPIVLKDGVASALAWSDTIEESILRQGAVTFIAHSVADENPRQAAEMVLALPDLEFQERALDDIASSWAESNLAEATNWAESLDPVHRDEAAAGIVRELASSDPAKASRWMNSLAGTTDLDPAIRSFVRAVAEDHPEMAMTWTAAMANGQERERNSHRVIGEWMKRAPAAAQSWMERNADQVPETVRKRFAPNPGPQELPGAE